MTPKNPLRTPLLIFGLLILLLAIAYDQRQAIFKAVIMRAINWNARAYFSSPLEAEILNVSPTGRVYIKHLRGKLRTESGPVAVEVGEIRSLNSIFRAFTPKGALFSYRRARPLKASRGNIEGVARYKFKNSFFELTGKIREIGLEDLQWINQDNLRGSTGKLEGTVMILTEMNQRPDFELDLHIGEPGGQIQSRFFEVLRPYLPTMPEKLPTAGELVPYQKASVNAKLPAADKLKVFLHIEIPAYNLNLNLNIEVHTDEKDSFGKLAELMGIVKIHS